jgi:hypothetical protein
LMHCDAADGGIGCVEREALTGMFTAGSEVLRGSS